ncbi:hypothetical protein ACCAA_1070001 [Candidatus Accumulibacter aalborgensis]|uniref:Uncharacterized protein n=1 Tax=Candidatus Accumulibacter aalborgensis TaxID=1860102 RepID=A0A1A8XFS4_9PROT|nr:hypothetical protein ACCAA_1070001 [Candidatus Accumulibacter aalborgensis]
MHLADHDLQRLNRDGRRLLREEVGRWLLERMNKAVRGDDRDLLNQERSHQTGSDSSRDPLRSAASLTDAPPGATGRPILF